MSGFLINLAALPPGMTRVEARAEPAELDLPPDGWSGPVTADFRVDKSGEMVSVLGTVRALARLQCVRCLVDFDCPVEVDLTVVANRSPGSGRSSSTLDDDDNLKFHDGRQLDVRDVVRESVLLELPITAHCRESCRGLCPRCGADLNQGPCGCAAGTDEH